MVKQILVLVLILPNIILAQEVPKTLKEAMAFLIEDCPAPIQEKLKETDDENIHRMIIYETSYRTVQSWLNSGEGEAPALLKFFKTEGIRHGINQSKVIWAAFKDTLLSQPSRTGERLAYYARLEAKWDEEDRNRFTRDSLRGVYIPKDLEDCFAQLSILIEDSVIEEIQQMPEQDFLAKSHFGLGRWMRNNWSLWGGSRLSKYFKDMKIFHPDDMSGIIAKSYWRYLNKEPLRLEEQVKFYKDYWKDANTRTNKGIKRARRGSRRSGRKSR